MIILKCSTQSQTDLRSAQVLHNLLREQNLPGNIVNWRYHVFEMVLAGVSYYRPYLQNTETLDIVTIQHKAWNDEVRQLLHIRKQLGVWRRLNFRPDEKCLMVADNVSFHKTQSVKSAYEEEGWISENFPPNMTDELQPMDLVVNRTFKNVMRQKRSLEIYDYLQEYRNLLNRYYTRKGQGEIGENNPYPMWTPPKSNYKKAVVDVFNCIHNELNNEYFQRSMTKCFVDVGLVRPVDQYKLPTNYVNYCRKKLGHASLKIEDDLNEGDCIAGWIIDFVQRADQTEESDEESDCDSVNV
jgi:hypothetical protein